MNADTDPELSRRSARHAALGDPARLAIVDALVLGDAAPSRLGEELGMASNLLAHHIGVLTAAGVVRRVRSEGDRRRSYLTLVAHALDGLNPAGAVSAPRIVFVCTENAARSQVAAALWTEHSAVPSASAGTHPAPQVHPGAVAAAQRHDLALHPQAPRRLDDVLRPGDFVITVCDRAHEELPATLDHAHWSVADPARTGEDEAFDRAFRELTERVTLLAPTVHTQPGPRPRRQS